MLKSATGNKPGPDRATTTVGEDISFSLRAGGKVSVRRGMWTRQSSLTNILVHSRRRTVSRREDSQAAHPIRWWRKGRLPSLQGEPLYCKMPIQGQSPDPQRGWHRYVENYRSKIPAPLTVSSVETPPLDDAPPVDGPSISNTGGKYVPPSMRGSGANRGPGESMRGSRDDLPTIRVTNISEDTQEQDLRDLFSYVGRVARVYVGRDRETGAGRGFAFVSFEDKDTAQRAINRMNGRGYDNLILNVGWSRKLPSFQCICFIIDPILKEPREQR